LSCTCVFDRIFQRSQLQSSCACRSMSSAPSIFTDKKYSVCILAAAGVAAATQRQDEGFSLSSTQLLCYAALAFLPAAMSVSGMVSKAYEDDLKLLLLEKQRAQDEVAKKDSTMTELELARCLSTELTKAAAAAAPPCSIMQSLRLAVTPWYYKTERDVRDKIDAIHGH
jgi:hypothetical protein